jgi:hypothetical protein
MTQRIFRMHRDFSDAKRTVWKRSEGGEVKKFGGMSRATRGGL